MYYQLSNLINSWCYKIIVFPHIETLLSGDIVNELENISTAMI